MTRKITYSLNMKHDYKQTWCKGIVELILRTMHKSRIMIL